MRPSIVGTHCGASRGRLGHACRDQIVGTQVPTLPKSCRRILTFEGGSEFHDRRSDT